MKVMTGYSYNHSVGHIEEVMDRLVACGYPAAPISDFCSTFGFVQWRKLAKKKELKPIYGVTINVTTGIHDKRPATCEFTFYAREKVSAIHDLIELATNQFRYTPLLTYEQVANAEGVYVIAGHRANFEHLAPAEHVFVALSPAVYPGYFRAAKERGFQFIASSENRYTNDGDRFLYETIMGRNKSTQSYAQFILDPDQWRMAIAKSEATEADIAGAWANVAKVVQGCTADLPTGTLLSPHKEKSLRELCEEGALRLGCNLTDPIYSARLDRELTLIEEKGFGDYFYIVSEMIQWSKQHMMVGPGRGSSSGSLVCYLLGITMVDPIPYNLLFERFIDINRLDLPDIDIDFSDQKRHMVFTHMEQLYGKERTARLGTVSLYKPKSVIKEAAASLNIPGWKTTPVLESMIETSSGDARALRAIEDTFKLTPAGQRLLLDYPEMHIATRMEGHPANKSQHAAGVIVTELPIKEYVAVDSMTGGTYCNKKDAEDLNLLKIDALGLTQLSIFEDCLAMIDKPHTWLDTIPLDDPEAFEVLNDRKYSGIFQFEGQALQRVAKEINITCLDDIVSLTALARPGPLSSGSTAHWIKRKNQKEAVDIPHEIFEPYLLDTFGVVVYQEQIMSIVREVGGLSWEDTSNLRKAMSKSLGREYFDRFGDPFKAECKKKGVPEAVAFTVWDSLCAFGAWCFNKSHAVAYGIISYQCAYLKAHYPLEFAAATLTHKDKVESQLATLREMLDEGVRYISVHPEHSTDKWRVATIDGERLLVGPVQNVKGIGPKIVQEIMTARAMGLPLSSRAAKLLANPTTKIDSLSPIADAFRRVMPDPRERNINTPPTRLIDVQVTGEEYDVLVFVVMAKINPKDENEDINVMKRGYKYSGPHLSLGLHLADDSDNVYAKVNRFDYETIAKPIINRGRPLKALYAIKGTVPRDFRMINIKLVRYIGDIDPKHEDQASAEANASRANTGGNPNSYGSYSRANLASAGSETTGEPGSTNEVAAGA
jgi:DNA polymerase III alpha subunit